MFIYKSLLVSLYLVAIFIFSHLFPSLCNCLYQKLHVSVIDVLLWGLYVHYISSALEQMCAMQQSYFSYICQICVQCPLPHGWLQGLCMWHIYVHTSFYKSIKYLAYIPNLVGIFVSSTYMAIKSEVCIAVGFALGHICKNVGSICPFNVLFAWLTHAMW